MRIERFKGIATYIEEKLGRPITDAQCRKWADVNRPDPLPLDCFAGSVAADSEQLDAWIERNRGARRSRGRRGKMEKAVQTVQKAQMSML